MRKQQINQNTPITPNKQIIPFITEQIAAFFTHFISFEF